MLCGDSTNADRPGFSPSEREVGPHLEQVFARAEGRIIVTSFASNIHRVQQVIDAAAEEPVCGIILEAAFPSTRVVARWHFHSLPMDYLLPNRFDSLAKISKVHSPVVAVHARCSPLGDQSGWPKDLPAAGLIGV